MVIGILMVIIGAVLQFWRGNRAFKRRNQAGLETFDSYGKAVGTQVGERIVMVIGRLLIFLGLIWIGCVWLVNRMQITESLCLHLQEDSHILLKMETFTSQADTLRTHFAQRGGYLTSSQVRALGIDLKVRGRMLEGGEVEQIQRGVYRLTSSDLPEYADLIELQLRVPYARPILITALDLHGLTTTRPTRIQVAIPSNRTIPDLPTDSGLLVPTRGLRSRNTGFRDTPADLHHLFPGHLLRMSGKIGRQPYLEGLTNYLNQPNRNLPEHLRMASINQVEDKLRYDLEVLTHDETH